MKTRRKKNRSKHTSRVRAVSSKLRKEARDAERKKKREVDLLLETVERRRLTAIEGRELGPRNLDEVVTASDCRVTGLRACRPVRACRLRRVEVSTWKRVRPDRETRIVENHGSRHVLIDGVMKTAARQISVAVCDERTIHELVRREPVSEARFGRSKRRREPCLVRALDLRSRRDGLADAIGLTETAETARIRSSRYEDMFLSCGAGVSYIGLRIGSDARIECRTYVTRSVTSVFLFRKNRSVRRGVGRITAVTGREHVSGASAAQEKRVNYNLHGFLSP